MLSLSVAFSPGPCAGSSALYPKACYGPGCKLPPVEEEKWVRAYVFRTEKQSFTLVCISCYLLVGSNTFVLLLLPATSTGGKSC